VNQATTLKTVLPFLVCQALSGGTRHSSIFQLVVELWFEMCFGSHGGGQIFVLKLMMENNEFLQPGLLGWSRHTTNTQKDEQYQMFLASHHSARKSTVESWYLLYGSCIDCNKLLNNVSEKCISYSENVYFIIVAP
jgi:hypothetical protein